MSSIHECTRRCWPVAAALVLLVAGAARARTNVYGRLLRSTGWVVVPSPEGVVSGTCWLADRGRRLAVTCRHVVGSARDVLVYFPCYQGGRPVVQATYYLKNACPLVGRVVASDARTDLALLRLPSVPAGVEELPLADAGCGPGEDVHSVGNSGLRGGLATGTLWWYTQGYVRQVDSRRVRTPRGVQAVRLVETQSPVNEGDSGGPVVDDAVRLVAVNDSHTAGERLVSQGVDVAEVRDFLKGTRAASLKGDGGGTGPGLQGRWGLRGAGKGGSAGGGEWDFRPDGTFVASTPGHHRTGRYAYLNDALWLVCDDAVVLARPKWSGPDRFALRAGDTELNFERLRPGKPAAVPGGRGTLPAGTGARLPSRNAREGHFLQVGMPLP
jgi:hypothetical protein